LAVDLRYGHEHLSLLPTRMLQFSSSLGIQRVTVSAHLRIFYCI
jgi:hypothetical protein